MSIKYHCVDLWNELFKKGISIDKNAKNNVVIDQIHNVYHFKRTLKKALLIFLLGRISISFIISIILCIVNCILKYKSLQP